MANEGDYKDLETKWSTERIKAGSPELDALIGIKDSQSDVGGDIVRGDYFASGFPADDREINDTTYNLVKTGDKYMIVDGIAIAVDYFNVENGSFEIDLFLYAEDSNRSTFTATGGTPTSIGVPLNLDFVNKVSDAEFSRPDNVTLTGTHDFALFSSEFFRETQGVRESVSGTEESFFNGGRRIILSPNTEYLFATVTSGTAAAGSTARMRSQFYFTEAEAT